MYHMPVLQHEIGRLLSSIRSPKLLIDATLGDGGHALLMNRVYPSAHIIGIDRDSAMLHRASERLVPLMGRNITLAHGWFDEIFNGLREGCDQKAWMDMPSTRWLRKASAKGVDGVLFDLGISTVHYALHNMGFSFAEDAPLDMRLDTQATLTAAHIVNRASVKMLEQLLWHYGNEQNYRSVANEIYQMARQHPIETTGQLLEVIKRAYGKRYTRMSAKQRSRRRDTQRGASHRHFATKTFMALRIAVNDEFRRLIRALPLAFHQLRKGGVLACITFHSGEDRIVKQFFRFLCGRHAGNAAGVDDGAIDWSDSQNGSAYSGSAHRTGAGKVDAGRADARRAGTRRVGGYSADVAPSAERVYARQISKKPIVPSRDEILANRAARSAKLRAVQKITTMAADWFQPPSYDAIDVQSLC